MQDFTGVGYEEEHEIFEKSGNFVASRVATREVHERAIKIYTGKILTTNESPIFHSHVHDYPRRIGLSSVRSIDAS